MEKRLLALPLLFLLILSACSPAPTVTPAPVFPPVLVSVRRAASGAPVLASQTDPASPASALPFALPTDCSLYRLYPNPTRPVLAVEFFCGTGPEVIFYDLQASMSYNSGETLQTDSHFLTWSADGNSIYLKADTLGSPQIVRLDRGYQRQAALRLPETVYDMAGLPDGRILYSFTKGIGYGSEVWIADAGGRHARQLLARPQEIVAYLQPSPDGQRIAFILMPDSQTPFTVGGLWVMDAEGSTLRLLGEADAGHGYAPAWSPDGKQIAFVVRENPDDPAADQSAGDLLGNIYRVDIESGALNPVSKFPDAIVETPAWSPDGVFIAFNVHIRNGTIQTWVEDSGTLQPLSQEFACCAVWVPGK